MKLFSQNFDELGIDAISELIDLGISETQSLEFKAKPYGTSESQKKELLKDISALANTDGGFLIIGLSEENGVASALQNDIENADAEILRLENIVGSGLDPAIMELRIKNVRSECHSALIIQVPPSLNAPHRLAAFGTSRFYGRQSNGVYEMNTDHIRNAFFKSASIADKIRDFTNQRLRSVSKGQLPTPVTYGAGNVIIHVTPFSSFSSNNPIDLNQAFIHSGSFTLPNFTSYSTRFNYDGFLIYTGGDNSYGYVQIFRNGAIEALENGFVHEREGKRIIFPNEVEKTVFRGCRKLIRAMEMLSVNYPIQVSVTLTGTANGIFRTAELYYSDRRQDCILEDTLTLPDIFIRSQPHNDDELFETLKPAIDVFWNSAGFAHSPNFGQNGTWTPKD